MAETQVISPYSIKFLKCPCLYFGCLIEAAATNQYNNKKKNSEVHISIKPTGHITNNIIHWFHVLIATIQLSKES